MSDTLYHLIVFCVSIAACVGLIVLDPHNASIYSGLVSALVGGGAVITGSKIVKGPGNGS